MMLAILVTLISGAADDGKLVTSGTDDTNDANDTNVTADVSDSIATDDRE